MAMNLFVTRSLAGNAVPSGSEISTFLKTQKGITLRNKQDESTIKAIENPVKFIKKRGEKITKLVDDGSPIVNYYHATLKKFMEDGIPPEEAHNMAYSLFDKMYNLEIEALDTVNPGYEKAFGTVTLHHNAKLANAGIVDHALPVDANVKVKDYQTKYRALKTKVRNG